MRKFFRLGFAPDGQFGKAVHLQSHDLAGFRSLAFNEAKRIDEIPESVTLVIPDGRRNDFDVVVNPLGWRIVSKTLASRIKKVASDDFDAVPVILRDASGKVVREDFVVLNALEMIDALSETRSVRSPVRIGTLYPVLRIAVKERSIPEHIHVFRLVGCQDVLLIDGVAKAAIEDGPHDGLVFIPVDQG